MGHGGGMVGAGRAGLACKSTLSIHSSAIVELLVVSAMGQNPVPDVNIPIPTKID